MLHRLSLHRSTLIGTLVSTNSFSAGRASQSIAVNKKLKQLFKSGKVHEAFDLFGKSQKQKLPFCNYTLSALLNGCINNGESLRCEEIWNELVLKHNVTPNVVNYSLAISGAANCGNETRAKKLASEMIEKQKDKMQILHWNRLMQALTKLNDGQFIINCLNEMESMKRDNKLQYDRYTYSIVLNALNKGMQHVCE